MDRASTKSEGQFLSLEHFNLFPSLSRDRKQLTEDAFREMDKNSDGRVSEEEFLRAVMAHEKVATLLALKVVQVRLQQSRDILKLDSLLIFV